MENLQTCVYLMVMIQIGIVFCLPAGYIHNQIRSHNYGQQYFGMSGTPVTALPKPYLPIEPPQPTAAVLSLARGNSRQQALQKSNHVAFVGPAKSFITYTKHHSRKTETYNAVNIGKNMHSPADYNNNFQFQQPLGTNLPTTVATYTSNNDYKPTIDSNGVDIYQSKSIHWYGPKVKSQESYGQQPKTPLNNFGLQNNNYDNNQQNGDLDTSAGHYGVQQQLDNSKGQQEYHPTLPSNAHGLHQQQDNTIGQSEFHPTLPSNVYGRHHQLDNILGQPEFHPTLPSNLHGLHQQEDNNIGQSEYQPTLPSNSDSFQNHQNDHNALPSSQPQQNGNSITASNQSSNQNNKHGVGKGSQKASVGTVIFSHREAMRRFKNRSKNTGQTSNISSNKNGLSNQP